MKPQQSCEPPPMTDADAIRAVYPRHTMKRLARAVGVPLDTARHWLYRHLSADRRREVATALLAQWDEEDRRRAACRKYLERMAVGDEMDRAGDRVAVPQTRREKHRPPTR
jgi:hypothetical protein